ncbi:MAG: hypothetical protein NXY57DRAFT_1042968 [Lentinula lateritia]|nr:MAG: hypothetical protein NXY57DRAFT_1042968 [Lentinula lateritia]
MLKRAEQILVKKLQKRSSRLKREIWLRKSKDRDKVRTALRLPPKQKPNKGPPRAISDQQSSRMGSNPDDTLPATRIKFPSFDFSSVLESDNIACMAAEDAGEVLDDGEIEFEDRETDEEACAGPAPPAKKHAKLTKRSHAKRAAEAVERVMSRGVKPFIVELAKGALPLELEDFDASSLPVSSTGWNTNSRKKLSPGLQRVWKNLEVLSSLDSLKLL